MTKRSWLIDHHYDSASGDLVGDIHAHTDEPQRRRARDHALFQLADRWQRCTNLRGVIEAVRQVAVEEVGAADANPGLSSWLAWAGRVAERHDPLTGLRRSSPMGSLGVAQIRQQSGNKRRN